MDPDTDTDGFGFGFGFGFGIAIGIAPIVEPAESPQPDCRQRCRKTALAVNDQHRPDHGHRPGKNGTGSQQGQRAFQSFGGMGVTHDVLLKITDNSIPYPCPDPAIGGNLNTPRYRQCVLRPTPLAIAAVVRVFARA